MTFQEEDEWESGSEDSQDAYSEDMENGDVARSELENQVCCVLSSTSHVVTSLSAWSPTPVPE